MRLAVVIGLSVCLLNGSPIYRVIDLGTLGGSSAATSLNSNGRAAGWSLLGSQSVRAMESDGRGGPQSLDPAHQSRAYGINDSGQSVGVQYDAYGNAHAVIWGDGGDSLGELGGANSYALAINSSGTVAGAVAGRAARFTGHGEAVEVEVNAPWSSANAINSSGGVAGTAQPVNGQFRAFSATAGGQVAMIGTLAGGWASYGQALNDEGWVVGGATTARGYMHAFLFANGRMQDLGTLGGGNSGAYGVNSGGQVVGYSNTPDGQSSAFQWENGVMRDLNTSIAADTGWRLLEASAINERGQIAGFGLFGGVQRAFRLDPIEAKSLADVLARTSSDNIIGGSDTTAVPEPGSLLLIAFGVAGLAFGLARPSYFS